MTAPSRISHWRAARCQAFSGGASVPGQRVPTVEKWAPNESREQRCHTLGDRSFEAGNCCWKPAPKREPVCQAIVGFVGGRAPTRRPRAQAKTHTAAHPPARRPLRARPRSPPRSRVSLDRARSIGGPEGVHLAHARVYLLETFMDESFAVFEVRLL